MKYLRKKKDIRKKISDKINKMKFITLITV